MDDKGLGIHEKGRAYLVFAFTACLLFSCGDANLFEGLGNDETQQAKIESAKIDLDKGNYSVAIATLQELCGTNFSQPTCDAETASLLASAYSGRAGLDAIDLINKATNTSGGTTNSFSTFSAILPTLTESSKNDMHIAVTLLSGLSSRTANQSLQMAIVATADLITTVGVDLTNGYNTNTGAPNSVPTLSAVQSAETNLGTVTQVSNDLSLVVQGVAGSALSNQDLTNDITEIENNLDADQNGIVTASELQSYLASL
jgi:hypothetical protein